jgi:hypothetical protein
MDACTPKKGEYNLITVEDYEPLIGAEGVERIGRKAECLRDLHVIAVNSTYYGGGVAQDSLIADVADEHMRRPNRLARHTRTPRLLHHHQEDKAIDYVDRHPQHSRSTTSVRTKKSAARCWNGPSPAALQSTRP